MPSQNPAAGLNTNIGADYRVFFNNFIFSFGVEAMYALYANNSSPFNDTIYMRDTEGDQFQMVAQVGKPRDLAHMLNVNIPILFGGEWGRFYFMVGPKISLNVFGATSSSATYNTYGRYIRAYDDFVEMPNHMFENGLTMGGESMPLKWKMNVMAHAEVGARINHMFKHKQFRINPDKVRMYIAAYVDCGILNVYSSTDDQPWYKHSDPGQELKFYLRPLLRSSLAANTTFFRNFNVGIKYTVAFEMPKHGKSYVYDYEKVERNYRIRGGNQTIK